MVIRGVTRKKQEKNVKIIAGKVDSVDIASYSDRVHGKNLGMIFALTPKLSRLLVWQCRNPDVMEIVVIVL